MALVKDMQIEECSRSAVAVCRQTPHMCFWRILKPVPSEYLILGPRKAQVWECNTWVCRYTWKNIYARHWRWRKAHKNGYRGRFTLSGGGNGVHYGRVQVKLDKPNEKLLRSYRLKNSPGLKKKWQWAVEARWSHRHCPSGLWFRTVADTNCGPMAKPHFVVDNGDMMPDVPVDICRITASGHPVDLMTCSIRDI